MTSQKGPGSGALVFGEANDLVCEAADPVRFVGEMFAWLLEHVAWRARLTTVRGL